MGKWAACALGGLILSGAAAVVAKPELDYPVTLFIDGFLRRSALLDFGMVSLARLDLLKGVVIIAGICYVWFNAPHIVSRAKLVAGTIAAVFAALASRAIQLVLPALPRPLDDTAINIIQPLGTPADEHDAHLFGGSFDLHWSSFPSDHASLLFGLAMAIAAVRPGLGVVAFTWALLATLARVYSGLHFLTDIAGGACLGVAMVCLSQLPAVRVHCTEFPRWATRRPGLFYALAFIALYSAATLFDDVRALGRGLSGILH